ncbi:hypothetical protein MP638_006348 [Amoeboaphelidium occidentale]|nr:hypothetical protein MP638_006348 [Amoeboaphelidium occidentale]
MMNRIRNMEIMESMAGNKIDYQTFRKRQEWIDYIQRLKNTPDFLKDIGITVVEKWYSLSSSQKFLACMISVNVAVFLLWQVPPMFRLMDEFFINRFITRYTPSPSITLLTSVFSHKDFMHLGFNMFGLWSFGPAAIALMGSPYHFLSFYISSGVFSSLCSRYLRGFSYGGSLGASGALFSIVAYLAVNRPDMKLSLIFLPMFPFSIGEGLSALALFDLFCILTGRFVFDHIAHLGGVAFGLMYAHFNGVEIWRQFERMSLSYWRKKDKTE